MAGEDTAGSTIADTIVLADPKDFYKELRDEDGIRFDPELNAFLIAHYDDL
jgi:hypothetical protein